MLSKPLWRGLSSRGSAESAPRSAAPGSGHDLEQHLVFRHVPADLARCPLHCMMARFMAACQVSTEWASASRTGPVAVVELHGAADEMQPESISIEVRFIQLSNMARSRQCRAGRPWLERTPLLKTLVVFADHRDLQPRASRNGQTRPTCSCPSHRPARLWTTLQPDMRGQAQRGINDGRLGLLAFVHGPPFAPGAAAVLRGVMGRGHGKIKRTIVLFCTNCGFVPVLGWLSSAFTVNH